MNTSVDLMPVIILGALVLLIVSLAMLFGFSALGKTTVFVLQALLLMPLILIFFIFDSAVALSRSWIFCGLFLVAGVGVSFALYQRFRSRISLTLGALFALGILICPFIDLTPVKPYRRFFSAIHAGMGKSEVMVVLHREFPDGGSFPVPVLISEQSNRLAFSLDASRGAYDAEIVSLGMNDGKVVSKTYWPD